MRVEQQNTSVVDVLRQDFGPEEQAEGIFGGKAGITGSQAACSETYTATGHSGTMSVNMRDATYQKPGAEEEKTTVEELEQSASMDAAERKNQMTVLAGTTSQEDYARMQKEGFSLDESSSNTIITVTDKIKAELAKAGVDISVFGDDLNMEQLEKLAGSPEFARQLAEAFREADIPANEGNIRDAVDAMHMAAALHTPGDDVVRYLMENSLPPTIENLYRAEYSGGYQGYEGQRINMAPFMDQVERIIVQAGLPVNDQTVAACGWLLENEIPLNEDNLTYLEELRGLSLPPDGKKVAECIAAAVTEGSRPQDAVLVDSFTKEAQAENTHYVVNHATDADLEYVIDSGLEVNVRSLALAMAARAHGYAAAGGSAAGKAGGTAAADTLETGTSAGVPGASAGAGGVSGNAAGVGAVAAGIAGAAAKAPDTSAGAGGVSGNAAGVGAVASGDAGTSAGVSDAAGVAGIVGAGTSAGTAGTHSAHVSGTEDPEASSGAAGTYRVGQKEDAQGSDLSKDAQNGADFTRRELALLTARRQLEEVRLAMTVQANLALLKKGIQIDTEPMAQLIERLKQTENEYYENLLRAQGVDEESANVALLQETTQTISDLKYAPAYVIGMPGIRTASISEVGESGRDMRGAFERANERYETLMTAPRADLGDSIQKAFRNVDDILTDLGLERTETNRRAVRILGYNQTEITPETIAEMKSVDEEVQRAFRNMTPAMVVEMIRRGINPLDMNFSGLNELAEKIGKELNAGREDYRGFGEFLWKLEKHDAITKEERASYIGIYRLIHQVESSDGAVIGALINQGADVTMRNLMMAVRTGHHAGEMDYIVDDSFGERAGGGMEHSITGQIETAYQHNCMKDVADALTPDRLSAVMEQEDWENMTPEQLKEALQGAETEDDRLDMAYAGERLKELAESAKASRDIYSVLQKYDIPNTVSNILAMEEMIKNRNGMFRKIFGEGVKEPGEEVTVNDLEKIRQELLEEFGEAVSSPAEMAEAQEKLGELAENVMRTMIESDEVTSLDVREMRMLSAQLSLHDLMAREEQYSVPVLVQDGVVNVSLKIVRGADKKGIVDVMMESGLRGKIAATFQAKAHGIKGFVASENPETEKLLKEHADELTAALGEEAEMSYAGIRDLDLDQFSSGVFGINAKTQTEETDAETEDYQVQTTRLYHIAETFIRQLREVL
ncbi:MAG: hypothetical protein HFI35_08510 [Roseburia sp.]|nr:hypothetical protein [Roseburia sp.]